MKSKIILTFLSILFCLTARSEPIDSRVGHFYWGLGPNFGLLGNVRLGFSNIEFGVLQNAGFGIAYIRRTNTPLFLQIGAVSVTGGGGILGGGGLEWNTSSFFRFRTDITVTADSNFGTVGYVSFGGVFIL